MIKFVLHLKKDGDITKSIQSKDEQTARSTYIHETYVHHPKKIRTSWILNQTRTDFPSTNILLFQTLFKRAPIYLSFVFRLKN